MPEIDFKVSKGNFLRSEEARALLREMAGPVVKRAGLVVQSEEMKQSPVRSGNLRRSWAVSEPYIEDDKLMVRVGTASEYANRVNLTSRQNAGFIERALAASTERAKGVLSEALEAIAGKAWKQG